MRTIDENAPVWRDRGAEQNNREINAQPQFSTPPHVSPAIVTCLAVLAIGLGFYAPMAGGWL